MRKSSLPFLATLVASVALAANSAPTALPIASTIPAARDVPFPGVITLAIDATDVTRGIFQVSEIIPVSPGPLVLLYPAWVPGDHSPTGTISKLAGLKITAAGQSVAWKRDPVDVFAFHLEVPAGANSLHVEFQYLSPTADSQGSIVATPEMLNLGWTTVSLYPAGHYVRQIMVAPAVKYPAGWKTASALAIATQEGATLRYRPVNYETLMDSPVFAGAHARTEMLSPDVRLNLVADQPEQLAMTEEQLQFHRNLVTQTLKLFGAQHYDRYDFLFALSDRQGGVGMEHHRSSENGVESPYFTDWKGSITDRDLLAHEFVHSWNGKYRRPADLWTPDYRTPMQDSLLWVYEGQTQFWGFVLSARAGLLSPADTLDAFAYIAATYDTLPGRTWRPLLDTTNDPIIAQRRPQAWRGWQRSEDYYNEGLLVWLDADSLLRELSGGARSLDDFARAFFGINDRDWGELTYTFDDIVATLNGVQPYDWAMFLHQRLDRTSNHAPLEGFTRGGYRLVYTDTPTDYFSAAEKARKITDLSYSGGFTLGHDGAITGVVWDGPAFNAGLTIGSTLIAVNGRALDADQLKSAIKAKKSPLHLLVKTGDIFRTVELTYDGGLRYPRLEKIPGSTAASLDALLIAKP